MERNKHIFIGPGRCNNNWCNTRYNIRWSTATTNEPE